MSCVGVDFSNMTLQSVSYYLSNSLSCLGDFHGNLLANNAIRCNPVMILEDLFGDKRRLVGTPFPSLLRDLIRITFIDFKKFHCTRCSYYPSVPLNSSCLFLHSPS